MLKPFFITILWQVGKYETFGKVFFFYIKFMGFIATLNKSTSQKVMQTVQSHLKNKISQDHLAYHHNVTKAPKVFNRH